MKLVLRLPYYVHPTKPAPEVPVLLFLHGVGESFVSKLGEIGHQNLLRQGPPKHLGALAPGHPLLDSFTLVAPQLPDRETLWSDVVDDVEKILLGHPSSREKLYIIGFSKGGLGAFQVAERLNARAVVTIDASPMDFAPADAVARWITPLGQRPRWAIYTSYEPGERFRKIQEFNELIPASPHIDIATLPKAGSQWRSFERAPQGMTPVERHVWICDQVTSNVGPYNWLLQH